MDLIAQQVAEHLDRLVPPRDPLTTAMEEEARRTDFPIIGPASGHLCYLLARLVGAREVFELGSGFGYSTAWFARAVKENGGGTVHHVVWDQALSERARHYLDALGLADQVRFHLGEAVETLRGHQGAVDLVFNDIEKHAYPASLPVIEDRLRPGGLLLVDNLLWSGRIFDPADTSPNTEGVRTLTALITTSPRWIGSIVPVRDGVMVARFAG